MSVGFSTGALSWSSPRVQDRAKAASMVDSDYIELLLGGTWAGMVDDVLESFSPMKDRILTVHAFKATSLLSSSVESERRKGMSLLQSSFEVAAQLGAESVTAHVWNGLSPDLACRSPSVERVGEVVADSQTFTRTGTTLSIELLPARNVDMLDFVRRLNRELALKDLLRGVAFTLDLEFAAYQGDLDSLLEMPGLYNNIHVKDYDEEILGDEGRAGYCEFGRGSLNFGEIFRKLASSPNPILYTIEAPAPSPAEMQKSVDLVRGYVGNSGRQQLEN